VGYGDITPKTGEEYAFVLFLLLLGTLFFSYVTALLSSFVADADKKRAEFRAKVKALKSYCKNNAIDHEIQSTLFKHSIKAWKEQEDDFAQQKSKSGTNDVLQILPKEQGHALIPVIYKNLISSSNFLSQLNLVDGRTGNSHSFTEQFLLSVSDRKRFVKGAIMGWQSWPLELCMVILSGTVEISVQFTQFQDGVLDRSEKRWIQVRKGSFLGLNSVFLDSITVKTNLEFFKQSGLDPESTDLRSTWLYTVRCSSDECEVITFPPTLIRDLSFTFGLTERLVSRNDLYLKSLSKLLQDDNSIE
jgi:CRP-like cAMP-binding protein